MPITIKSQSINLNTGNGYDTINSFFLGNIDQTAREWLDDHPEAAVPDHSLTHEKMVIGTMGFVTPEMYGAYGDGVNDDTDALQDALDSGTPVLASNTYLVSSISVGGTALIIKGEIKGQVKIGYNGAVSGGTIRQSANDPCVIFESDREGLGYLNGTLEDCNLIPASGGVGVKFQATDNPLFGYCVRNVDIASCGKSLYFYNNNWITKGTIENVYCHTPDYAVYIDNLQTTNTRCGDIVLRNVYAQYYNHKPINFVHLESGNCLITCYDSFCYDGVEDYMYYIPAESTETRFTLLGTLKADFTSAKFTNQTSLRCFYFTSNYVSDSQYLKMSAAKTPPVDYLGNAYFENMNSPSVSGSRFAGLVSRGGTIAGGGESDKVFGLSYYDGRLSLLRSVNGAISGANVYEVSTPYSGAVYTMSTLPTGVRDGAKCWCSDIKMDVTYYNGAWYKPDGTVISPFYGSVPVDEQDTGNGKG